MKKLDKILFIILSIVAILTIFVTYSKADTSYEDSGIAVQQGKKYMDSQVINPDDYKPSTDSSDNTQFISIANNVIGIVRYIGSILSVIALIVMGIKYMVGSIEERAEYKKSMQPYLIGAILLFAGVNLLQIIYDIVQNISGTI